MAIKLIRKESGPRTYLVVKDPKTKKAVGMTVRGMNAEQVIKKLQEVFNGAAVAA